jgi:aryl-alcohol dehydrogenase-like predicted oxidoreductase
MGYLAGTIDARTKQDPKTDLRAGFDRFSPASLAANRPIVEAVERLAARKNATPAQISLAWLLAQKPFIVPHPRYSQHRSPAREPRRDQCRPNTCGSS